MNPASENQDWLSPGRIAVLAGLFVVVLALLPAVLNPPSSISEAIRRYDPGLAVTAATALAIIAYVYYTHRSAQATERSARATERSAEATKLMAQVASEEMRREVADELTTLQENLGSLEYRLQAWRGTNFDELDKGHQPSQLLGLAEDDLDEAKAVIQKLPPSLKDQVEPAIQSVEEAEDAVMNFRIEEGPEPSTQDVKEAVSEAETVIGSTDLKIDNLLSNLPRPDASSES